MAMFEKRFRILQKKMPVSCITYLNSFNLLIEYDKICTEYAFQIWSSSFIRLFMSYDCSKFYKC